jgi:hypothetical protein
MEDASAMDLDWFWEVGSTPQFNDMGIKAVDRFYATSERNVVSKKIHWRKQNSRMTVYLFISIW